MPTPPPHRLFRTPHPCLSLPSPFALPFSSLPFPCLHPLPLSAYLFLALETSFGPEAFLLTRPSPSMRLQIFPVPTHSISSSLHECFSASENAPYNNNSHLTKDNLGILIVNVQLLTRNKHKYPQMYTCLIKCMHAHERAHARPYTHCAANLYM